MVSANKYAITILKLGVAFAFLYPALSAFYDPSLWIGYIPAWAAEVAPREAFLPLFSLFEIALALGVLFTNRALPAALAGLVLVAIVIINPSESPVVFRDLSIACAAFALALLNLSQ